MLKRLSRKKMVAACSIILGFLAVYAAVLYYRHSNIPFSSSVDYLEMVGPVQAEDVALQSSQAGHPLVNGHMYMHEVGAYIFDTYGVNGVGYCRNYFDYGCYNGFMLAINSTDTMQAALSACNKLGSDAFGGCIHGAGHEALLFSGYNVPEALQLCSTYAQYATTTDTPLTNCSFGVFMENAEPGMMEGMTNDALMSDMSMDAMNTAPESPPPSAHYTWALRKSDPSFPCDDPRIGAQYKSGCWRMQAVVLSNELPASQIVALCNGIADDSQKQSCFEGFADGSVLGPDMDVQKIVSDCDDATGAGWKDTCLIEFVERAYRNGYGDTVPNEICSYVDTPDAAACAEAKQKVAG